jgi:hypothetical protein
MLIHPGYATTLAQARAQYAERFGWVRADLDAPHVAPTPTAEPWAPILLRRSDVADLPALRRLAQLESRPLPDGYFLVAEIQGELVAAVSLEVDQPALGDPFRPTADIRRLLELQARALASGGGSQRTRAARLSDYSVDKRAA